MDLGLETIGNATLVCHDKRPVIVTDPWIAGHAYFGSWGLSHEIPAETLESINSCQYMWVSHGHPDHLSSGSLASLRDKQFLIPDHVGGRICDGLRERGFDVTVLKSKRWYPISDRIRILRRLVIAWTNVSTRSLSLPAGNSSSSCS
jgi:L-ascorbate metabolism protein UlaG (beta-lactamase superfamily)